MRSSPAPSPPRSQELAVYGDVTFKLTDALKLNAGLRKFRTEASYSEPNRNVLDFATFTYVHTSFKNEGEDSDYTWRAGLSYDFSDSAMVYGNVSKGYRVGQVNPNNGPSFVDPSDIVIPEAYAADSTHQLRARRQDCVVRSSAWWPTSRSITSIGAISRSTASGSPIDRTFITNAGAAEVARRGAGAECAAEQTDSRCTRR